MRHMKIEGGFFLGAAVVLSLVSLVTNHWWPGSAAGTIARALWFVFTTVWMGLKIRAGYQRRRPHWTRESWLRYLRLAVMPVAAIALMLYLSSFDMSLNTFGAPRSTTRGVFAFSMLALMILGVIGTLRAIDWMERGEPSEQFTRTMWFQRRPQPPG
jgi:hypothetical protein